MNQKAIINVVLVYVLLFLSGTHFYLQSPDKFLVLAFLGALSVWLYTDRDLDEGFVLYVVVFAGFLLIISLYTNGSLELLSVISTTLKLVTAYLILKVLGNRFTDSYIKVVVVLAGVSLFGFLSDTFHLFNSVVYMLPKVGNIGYEGILYTYRYDWHYDRNMSIFFEPGAYQGILNSAILLLIFSKTNFVSFKQWVYLLVLLVALVTTFSTTGYLIFAVMFGLFMIKGQMLSVTGKIFLLITVLMLLAVFSAHFQHVIFEKIESYTSIQDITDRGNLRSFDAIVDLEIFRRNIFGSGYIDYSEAFSAVGLVREGYSSSNGVTKTLAIYGLPFSLFLFGSYYWAIRKFFGNYVISIIPFGMLLMFFVGEAYYVFTPVALAIVAAGFVFHQPTKCNTEIFEAEVSSRLD